MRKLISGVALAVTLWSIPAVAEAQRRAAARSSHEFGVDVGVAYVKPSNVDGGIAIQTPFDVRYGFVPRSGNMMWEPRATLTFSTVGGVTTYLFTPGVNVLFSNTPGGHRRGMFFLGGAGLVMGDGGGGSGTAFKLEAGVGWRKPYGTAAWRYELGFQWVSESAELGPFADYIAIGGRIGISLWN
ncbi:MAG: hypothetical protein Q8Q14_16260 [Gemmatimonadales bacterium]|nr:hypothetical protein [Gemmatimonadales bacterium]